jgi:uncharacterized protein involved in exopolysaccharide biosynthesis
METIPLLSLKDILLILFKRKRTILLVFFSTVLTVTFAAVFLKQPMYQSDSQILLEAGRGFVYNPSIPTQEQMHRNENPSLEREIALSSEILKNEMVLNQLVRKIGPARIYEDLEDTDRKAQADPVKLASHEILENLDVVTVENSPIISISFKHKDPMMAATVVNTLVKLYVEHHLRIRQKPQLFKFFKKQYDIMAAKLNTSEIEMDHFKKRFGISSSLTDEKSLLAKRCAQIQAELDQSNKEQAEIANRIQDMSQRLTKIYNPNLIDEMLKDLHALRFKEKLHIEKYGEQSAELKKIRQDIKRKTNEYDLLLKNKRRGNADTNNFQRTLYQDLEKELVEHEIDLNAIEARIAALKKQHADYTNRLNSLDAAEAEFMALESQLTAARENYQLYQTTFEEFRIFDALDKQKIADIKILQPAQPSVEPLPSKRLLMLIMAIFFGGTGSIGIAIVMEYISGVINTGQDVENILQRPLLASIMENKQVEEAKQR